jgi:hypothetical protein
MLTVAAWAPRGDVFFDTGASNMSTVHNANGVGWYFNGDWSWGFANEGDAVQLDQCDDLNAPNPALRLCWQASNNSMTAGFRCGALMDPIPPAQMPGPSAQMYRRLIFQAD